jgi:Ser-tRNA(Ala) deacylase AlaX
MLQKLFWDDPYLTETAAKVTSVKAGEVRLDRTVFYAFSGGQESDAGTIGGFKVLAASKDGHDIIYTLPGQHNLAAGQEVRVSIDWARRYHLMRNHFAAELILELVYARFKEIKKTGAHIAEDKARIDFLWESNISPFFPELVTKATELIRKNQPIISGYSDIKNQTRFWEVEGFSRVACGGTHLRRTGEVGEIRLKRKNTGKGKERIEIYTL